MVLGAPSGGNTTRGSTRASLSTLRAGPGVSRHPGEGGVVLTQAITRLQFSAQ